MVLAAIYNVRWGVQSDNRIAPSGGRGLFKISSAYYDHKRLIIKEKRYAVTKPKKQCKPPVYIICPNGASGVVVYPRLFCYTINNPIDKCVLSTESTEGEWL